MNVQANVIKSWKQIMTNVLNNYKILTILKTEGGKKINIQNHMKEMITISHTPANLILKNSRQNAQQGNVSKTKM